MSKPPKSDSSAPSEVQANGAPRWETWTMALSFVALWSQFVADRIAERAGTSASAWWQLPAVISSGLLLWILARRIKRALFAIKALDATQPNRPKKR